MTLTILSLSFNYNFFQSKILLEKENGVSQSSINANLVIQVVRSSLG